jgi:HEAT repeat protein
MRGTVGAERLLLSIHETGGRKALAKLVGAGRAALPVARAGLRHPDWRVRRDCLRFLDHQADPESGRLVLGCLTDAHPDVRKWAVHALGCDRCKGAGRGDLDAVPHLLRVVREDPSLRVRRSAVLALAWNQPRDARVAAGLEDLLRTECDAKIRMHAEAGLARQRAGAG